MHVKHNVSGAQLNKSEMIRSNVWEARISVDANTAEAAGEFEAELPDLW